MTDYYLTNLSQSDLDVYDLAIHLRCQLEASAFGSNGPVLKAINVIRALIEDKGGDPDELLAQLKKEDEATGWPYLA